MVGDKSPGETILDDVLIESVVLICVCRYSAINQTSARNLLEGLHGHNLVVTTVVRGVTVEVDTLLIIRISFCLR